ncbi:class I SAM-dependent methyltransferase [Roseibium hamelinense]|nr:methyltransferase domain-containing protein [Roseibium hamelinense]MTI42310.1 class I SAM-dependent methyltransferase [Roseibium hamelinense]
MARRDAARERIDVLTGAHAGNAADRLAWFNAVYREANGDPAAVPWADLKPKAALVEWLQRHPGHGKRAIDIGCGLGDNAEALALAGYETTAFDLSPDAISWAKQRFSDTSVNYVANDLFAVPHAWKNAFDLVHECYTIQALDGDLRRQSLAALAGLVAPGGTLLVISRCREEGGEPKGPPWPLAPSEWRAFETHGLKIAGEHFYSVQRPDRTIQHVLAEFTRPA